MKTRILEREIFKHLQKAGTYMCFEVMMPTELKGIPNERVDLLTYNIKGDWGFYELKTNKSDFYSKNKHTFYGNYNYFVLPQKLFEIVADDIPSDIGV